MTVIFIYIGKRKEDNGSNMDWIMMMMMMMMIMEQGMCYHGFFIYLFIYFFEECCSSQWCGNMDQERMTGLGFFLAIQQFTYRYNYYVLLYSIVAFLS
ncbi:hypothetical protein BDA99DRAFT_515229, partial [Phascolomyces articulosus]